MSSVGSLGMSFVKQNRKKRIWVIFFLILHFNRMFVAVGGAFSLSLVPHNWGFFGQKVICDKP